MKKNVLPWALVCLVPFSCLLVACDMVHAVRITSKNNNVIDGSNRTSDINFMSTLAPVIEKHGLKCQTKIDRHNMSSQICKTWVLSYSKVRIFNDNTPAAVMYVEDLSPIFLWEPQPYGRIKTDVINTFDNEWRAGQLDCRQGFGFRMLCKP